MISWLPASPQGFKTRNTKERFNPYKEYFVPHSNQCKISQTPYGGTEYQKLRYELKKFDGASKNKTGSSHHFHKAQNPLVLNRSGNALHDCNLGKAHG